jgi:hypothetical protein
MVCPPSNPDLMQTDPALAFDGTNYVAVWSDEKYGVPNVFHTTLARITPGGAVLDTGTFVSPVPGASESRPNVACDSSRSLVVWSQSSTGIYGRFVTRAGLPEGDVIRFTDVYSGGASLAYGGPNYLVVWFSGTYPALELFGQLVTPGGDLVGGRIELATGPDCHRWADVVFDGSRYLVVWQTGDNEVGQTIYARFVGTDGSLIGTTFPVCGNTSSKRWWPAAAESDSNFIVTWGQGASSDIWGNVDVLVTGVAEPRAGQPARLGRPRAGMDLYDAAGRRVVAGRARPGVYFARQADGRTGKVVLTR